MLHNHKRFNSELYEGDSSVIQESLIEWIPFPRFQMLKIYWLKETLIEREDNLFMDIYQVTE